ncbi:hypothetical protein D9M69_535600 [compost metagenome]
MQAFQLRPGGRISRQTLDQDLENAATGQRYARALRPIRVAIAQDGDRLFELTFLQTFEKILLDTAA